MISIAKDIFALGKLAFNEIQNFLFVVGLSSTEENGVSVSFYTRLHLFNVILATCLFALRIKKFLLHLLYFLGINFLRDSFYFDIVVFLELDGSTAIFAFL